MVGDVARDVDCDVALGVAEELDYVRVAYELLMNRDLRHHILPDNTFVKYFQSKVCCGELGKQRQLL